MELHRLGDNWRDDFFEFESFGFDLEAATKPVKTKIVLFDGFHEDM